MSIILEFKKKPTIMLILIRLIIIKMINLFWLDNQYLVCFIHHFI